MEKLEVYPGLLKIAVAVVESGDREIVFSDNRMKELLFDGLVGGYLSDEELRNLPLLKATITEAFAYLDVLDSMDDDAVAVLTQCFVPMMQQDVAQYLRDANKPPVTPVKEILTMHTPAKTLTIDPLELELIAVAKENVNEDGKKFYNPPIHALATEFAADNRFAKVAPSDGHKISSREDLIKEFTRDGTDLVVFPDDAEGVKYNRQGCGRKFEVILNQGTVLNQCVTAGDVRAWIEGISKGLDDTGVMIFVNFRLTTPSPANLILETKERMDGIVEALKVKNQCYMTFNHIPARLLEDTFGDLGYGYFILKDADFESHSVASNEYVTYFAFKRTTLYDKADLMVKFVDPEDAALQFSPEKMVCAGRMDMPVMMSFGGECVEQRGAVYADVRIRDAHDPAYTTYWIRLESKKQWNSLRNHKNHFGFLVPHELRKKEMKEGNDFRLYASMSFGWKDHTAYSFKWCYVYQTDGIYIPPTSASRFFELIGVPYYNWSYIEERCSLESIPESLDYCYFDGVYITEDSDSHLDFKIICQSSFRERPTVRGINFNVAYSLYLNGGFLPESMAKGLYRVRTNGSAAEVKGFTVPFPLYVTEDTSVWEPDTLTQLRAFSPPKFGMRARWSYIRMLLDPRKVDVSNFSPEDIHYVLAASGTTMITHENYERRSLLAGKNYVLNRLLTGNKYKSLSDLFEVPKGGVKIDLYPMHWKRSEKEALETMTPIERKVHDDWKATMSTDGKTSITDLVLKFGKVCVGDDYDSPEALQNELARAYIFRQMTWGPANNFVSYPPYFCGT